MLSSMTGFARQLCATDFGTLTIEIRSVNHRYLEPSFRIPEFLRATEPLLRAQLQKKIARGKIDVFVRLDSEGADSNMLSFNEALAQEYIAFHKKASSLLQATRELSAIELMRFPHVIANQAPDPEYLQEKLIRLFNQVVDDLIENRRAEGARIEHMLSERLRGIHTLTQAAKDKRPNALSKIREKLVTKLEEFAVDYDPSRFEQELVLMAQKLDVDEEIDRLFSHITAMEAVFARNEPVGRRLDFLSQEFNREANTLGSKSQDADLTAIAVDLKVLIEQMREQIQNIE